MKLERKFKEYGFGFSPVTNQFKVTRMMISQFAHDAHTGEERYAGRVTEVHNLAIHSSVSVFQARPMGKSVVYEAKGTMPDVSMGVLGGCLCICDASSYHPINVKVRRVETAESSFFGGTKT
ncbi:hypothetical protein SADUNF_Sadunf16G0180000 [Salix dunnii]|uniref:Uncharacterized protein n=1 Tax=Salix dunnii TaxID=1413687 RepID=A0A835JAT2_9ROSI|nr:hypothetical protein SADUNF_Sadunf16G0180000 [Salix dunnii]